MTTKLRFSLSTATVLMIFVLSAIWAVPAFADDGAPPPTEPPITETDPTPPAPDSVAEPTADSAPVEEPAPITEVLDQLPEGTTVVVTDSAGEPLPLATEQAAQVIVENDPMWCPAGVTPGGAGCTLSYDSMDALITELNTAGGLVTNPAKAGVIWIAGSYQSSNVLNDPGITNFTLDGGVLTNMAKYALTIQGGWTGFGKTIDQFNPSEFNASLNILDWLAPITLNDILITGATVNPHVGDKPALLVQTTKNITLNRVQVIDNSLAGAMLDNGLAATSIAPIIINDSIFNGNTRDGLHVFSIGAITVRNLTANFNGIDDANLEYGAFLTNWLTVDTNQPVTLNGTNEFKGNLGTGLFISSFGIVTLNNITATANDDITDGGDDAKGVDIDASLMVRLTGTNLINYNQTNGLEISSDGTISLNNVNISNNAEGGAVLDNCLNPGPNTACSVVGKSVILTGTNIFNWNGFEGLVVNTDGAISISNVTASHNSGLYGVYLDNCAFDAITLLACTNTLPYAVSITTPSSFLYNSSDGLYIRTTGAVTLKGVTASFNQGRGVFIDNHASLLKPQNVILSGINVMNGNDNHGLRIISYGTVALASITANDNGQTDSLGYGVFVDNRALSAAPAGSVLITRKPVTFTGNNTITNNYSGGIFIYSVGDVTLSNITAVGNGLTSTPLGDGVHIENEVAWYPNGVTQTSYAARVTLNGFGIFKDNGDEGLQIFSRGAIKLNNVTANNNGDVGLWANNAYINTMSTRQPVTLTGTNSFNGNDGGGMMLLSFGAVTLNNLTAIGNLDAVVGLTGSGDGVSIQNNLVWSPNGVLTSYVANVTISGFGYFEGNTDDGLDILSKGAVTIAKITANSNGDDGAVIFTKGDLLPQNVTLNGSNNFYGNGFTSTNGNGLFIQSDGKITINNLSAIGNKANGARLDNFTDKKVNKFLGVTLTGFNFFQKNQGINGLFIHSDGSVLLYHVTADDNNSGNGINVVATKNITISCGSAFSNFGTGFFLNSGAILTLKGVHAYGNGADEILTPINPVRTWACP